MYYGYKMIKRHEMAIKNAFKHACAKTDFVLNTVTYFPVLHPASLGSHSL